jgi:predicted aconitase with swiveling domain
MTSGIEGRILVEGIASGTILRLDEPLSFWGGLDAATGEIIDRRHPQAGAVVTGRILVMPSGRGSSSSSSVLAEAIRAGTAPAGVVMGVADGIVALGALVAAELYGTTMPVIVVSPEGLETIPDGSPAAIRSERVLLGDGI